MFSVPCSHYMTFRVVGSLCCLHYATLVVGSLEVCGVVQTTPPFDESVHCYGRACGTPGLGAPAKLISSVSSRSTETVKPFLTPFLGAVLSCWSCSCCCCSGSLPRPMTTPPPCLFSLALALFKSGYLARQIFSWSR